LAKESFSWIGKDSGAHLLQLQIFYWSLYFCKANRKKLLLANSISDVSAVCLFSWNSRKFAAWASKNDDFSLLLVFADNSRVLNVAEFRLKTNFG